jgi:hypothetical protein
MDKAGPPTIDSVSVVQHPSPFVMHLYDSKMSGYATTQASTKNLRSLYKTEQRDPLTSYGIWRCAAGKSDIDQRLGEPDGRYQLSRRVSFWTL